MMLERVTELYDKLMEDDYLFLPADKHFSILESYGVNVNDDLSNKYNLPLNKVKLVELIEDLNDHLRTESNRYLRYSSGLESINYKDVFSEKVIEYIEDYEFSEDEIHEIIKLSYINLMTICVYDTNQIVSAYKSDGYSVTTSLYLEGSHSSLESVLARMVKENKK